MPGAQGEGMTVPAVGHVLRTARCDANEVQRRAAERVAKQAACSKRLLIGAPAGRAEARTGDARLIQGIGRSQEARGTRSGELGRLTTTAGEDKNVLPDQTGLAVPIARLHECPRLRGVRMQRGVSAVGCTCWDARSEWAANCGAADSARYQRRRRVNTVIHAGYLAGSAIPSIWLSGAGQVIREERTRGFIGQAGLVGFEARLAEYLATPVRQPVARRRREQVVCCASGKIVPGAKGCDVVVP